MKIQEIIEYLDAELHPELQEDYDNAGLQLGDLQSTCTGALVALDITEAVVEEAIESGANLIVTHHPMIFGGVKRISPTNVLGRMIYKLIRHDIAVYSAHTNLDNLSWGVNGVLSQVLGLTDCRILRPIAGQQQVGAGMVGHLAFPMPATAFLEQVKMSLGLPMLRVSPVTNPVVSCVAICGGSGSFLIGDAMSAQADIYLTGDLKYHDFQRAEDRITLVDIGHFESEQFSVQLIYSIISKKFSTFASYISQQSRGFVNYM